MVFNKLKIREVFIVLSVVLIIGLALIGKFSTMTVNDPNAVSQPGVTDIKPMDTAKSTINDEDDEALKKMMQQMQEDREQQRRIKALKMQREETDLEVEEQKALSELNKLKMDGMGTSDAGDPTDVSSLNIKILYVGGNEVQKEAILSINGTDYSVKEKDRPLKNIEIQSITNSDVTIHFLSPANTVNTYQFKSE